MDILEHARSLEEQIIAWRRDIHMHPELGFREFRTAKLVAEALTNMGIEAETGVGKTGVVARIGEGKPAIGIRADMDALPIHEANDASYASQTPNVMHACGHDAHTAILLGVARMLNEMPDRPAGEVRLLFQPSEEMQDDEGKSGAMRMIEDNALDGLDHVIALHVASGIPAGQVEIRRGYTNANQDSFKAVIRGTGGHGAAPHRGTDPVFMLAQVLNAIFGIRARRIDPTEPAIISIGSVHGGDAPNVIPADITITGTMRSYSDEIRQQLITEVEQALAITHIFGGEYELHIERGYDAAFNDHGVAEVIENVVTDLLGADHLEDPKAGLGAEDFGYMSRIAPGAMFILGAQYDDKNRPHHTPVFDINESSFHIGAAILAETTRRLLETKQG